jgi:molybdopterin-guanine dinucleotide biosynthesis protein A
MLGALLIGGVSRRMGSPKAMLDRDGVPLGVYLAELLADSLGTAPLLVGQGPFPHERYQRVADRELGGGPLSAVVGLIDAFPGEDFLVLATDLYAMNSRALSWLLGRQPEPGHLAIWPRFPDRDVGEPLAAVYRAAAGPVLTRYWTAGNRALIRGLTPEQRSEPVIPESHRLAFTNVNDPQSLARIKSSPEHH